MNFFIAQVEPACPEFHMFYYILPFTYLNPPPFPPSIQGSTVERPVPVAPPPDPAFLLSLPIAWKFGNTNLH